MKKGDYYIYKAVGYTSMIKSAHPDCRLLAAREQESYYYPKSISFLIIEWESCRTESEKEAFIKFRKHAIQLFLDRLSEFGKRSDLYQLYFNVLNTLQNEIVRFQTAELDINKLFSPQKQ